MYEAIYSHNVHDIRLPRFARNDKRKYCHLDKYAWSVFERVLYTRPEGRNPWMGEVTKGEISQSPHKASLLLELSRLNLLVNITDQAPYLVKTVPV